MSAPDRQPFRVSSSFTPLAARTLAWWGKRKSAVLSWAAALMALAALVWMGYGFWRLLWQPTPMGATDLAQRWIEVRDMFAGRDIYLSNGNATYPPASIAMLWPILSWPGFTTARWLWALLTVGALVGIVRVVVRASGATTKTERWVAMLLPLVMYATGVATGNGQLTIVVVACLLASLPILLSEDRGRPLALAALVFVAALAKASLAAPFFWMVLFRPKRPLWAIAIAAIYLGLTAVPGLAQPVGAIQLCHQYLSRIGYDAAKAAACSHANVQSWLISIRRPQWDTEGSLMVLGLLGLWTWRHRRADPWLLMSTAAFAARFWTYHSSYDDLILLIPMIALYRLAKQGATDGQKVWAASLLTVMLGSTLAPSGLSRLGPNGMYLLPPSLSEALVVAQVVVWLAVCVFLLRATRLRAVKTPSASAT
jgi:hypothetical protein